MVFTCFRVFLVAGVVGLYAAVLSLGILIVLRLECGWVRGL